jgi:cell division protease FtsH
VTTGAESDLEQVTRIARQMVGRWGMSDAVGKVSVLPRPDEEPLLFPGAGHASDQTLELVDAEVRRIVDECYQQALEQLSENRERLDTLADALVEHETLDEADIYRIAGIARRRELLPDEQVPEAVAEDGRARP